MRTVLLVGAGGVLAAALSSEFSEAGYRVFGLRRSDCDLQSAASTKQAAARLVAEHAIDVLIGNAAQLKIAPFLELEYDDLECAWRTGVASVVGAAQAVIPTMLQRQSGTILLTGATASVRGSAHFAAFSSAKFALRGLAQSLAREYQSRGIHVAHVVLDGILRGSKSAERMKAAEEHTLDPIAVARAYRTLVEQQRSAWTHELDLRPSSERF